MGGDSGKDNSLPHRRPSTDISIKRQRKLKGKVRWRADGRRRLGRLKGERGLGLIRVRNSGGSLRRVISRGSSLQSLLWNSYREANGTLSRVGKELVQGRSSYLVSKKNNIIKRIEKKTGSLGRELY